MVRKNRTTTKTTTKTTTIGRQGFLSFGRRHWPSLGMDGVCVLTFLFAVLFSTPVDADLTASNSSIVFYRQGENGYYGNNVTLRPSCQFAFGNMTWFDYETILPRGALKKVFFMACDYSQLDDASTRIRLQIWRPVNLSIPSLRLVWQQVVQLPTTTTGPLMYTYSINETVALVDGDRIGWEFEGSIAPICFEFHERHRTFFYRTTNMQPDVGQLVTFDAIFLPSQFSIAALVDGNLSGYPGSAGSTVSTVTEGATVAPASTSSIVFYRPGENGSYGNNVTLRPVSPSSLPVFPSSPPVSPSSFDNEAWLDFETILPSGVLRKVFFMACNYSQLDDASTRVDLQIWRPVYLGAMMLVWQQVVQLPTTTTGPMMYTYSINETVVLVAGDRIGWLFGATFEPTCFQYAEAHRTYFDNITNMYPGVGQLVIFNATLHPTQFSIAALVDGNLPTAFTGSTGTERAKGVTVATVDHNVWHLSQASRFEFWSSIFIFAVSLSVSFFISN